jgi:hypothetical protein
MENSPPLGNHYLRQLKLSGRSVSLTAKPYLNGFFKTREKHSVVELRRLSALGANWDSYGSEPPNRSSVALAQRLLQLAETADLPATRLMPSADGGITILFSNADRLVVFECLNSGEIVMAHTSLNTETQARDVQDDDQVFKECLRDAREFLA